MNAPGILLLVAAGSVAGFLGGVSGVGGGIILVPFLLFYYKSIGVSSLVATHLAFGTSLLIVVFASLSSSLNYWKNNHVVWKAVRLLGPASVAGALGGAALAASLPGRALQQFFAAVVVLAAIQLLVGAIRTADKQRINTSPVRLLSIGVFVGLLSSLAGVGGGVLTIPMIYYLLNFPLKKALGTSSATIVITALAAATGYVVNGVSDPLLQHLPFTTFGYIDYLHALPIILGTVPLAAAGANFAHRTQTDRLRKFFALFLLVVALRLFFF